MAQAYRGVYFFTAHLSVRHRVFFHPPQYYYYL